MLEPGIKQDYISMLRISKDSDLLLLVKSNKNRGFDAIQEQESISSRRSFLNSLNSHSRSLLEPLRVPTEVSELPTGRGNYLFAVATFSLPSQIICFVTRPGSDSFLTQTCVRELTFTDTGPSLALY